MSKNWKKIMLNFRYDMALAGTDEDIINMLDYWLEQWVARKDQCPNCGTDEDIG